MVPLNHSRPDPGRAGLSESGRHLLNGASPERRWIVLDRRMEARRQIPTSDQSRNDLEVSRQRAPTEDRYRPRRAAATTGGAMNNSSETLVRAGGRGSAEPAGTARFLCVESAPAAASRDIAEHGPASPRQSRVDSSHQPPHQTNSLSMKFKFFHFHFHHAAVAMLSLLATPHFPCATAHAALHVWTGAANGYWATPGNWQGNDAPTDPAETGIVLRFPDGPTRRITTNNIGHLNLTSLSLPGSNYVIRSTGGFALSFAPGGIAMNINSTGPNNSVGCPLQSASALTINVTAGDNLTVAGLISGPASLVKFGDGALTLSGSGANAFLDGCVVNGGTLRLRQNGVALPGPIQLGYGGANAAVPPTILLQANNQIAQNASLTLMQDGVLSLNGFTNGLGILSMVGGEVTTASNSARGLLIVNHAIHAGSSNAVSSIHGTMALNGECPVNVTNGTLAVAARVVNGANAGRLRKLGNGRLELTAANFFSGGLAMVEGDLGVGNEDALGSILSPVVFEGFNTDIFLAPNLTIANDLIVSNDYARVNCAGTNTWTGSISFLGHFDLTFKGAPAPLGKSMIRVGGVIRGTPKAWGAVAFDQLAYAEIFGPNGNLPISGVRVSGGTELRLNKSSGVAVSGDLYLTGESSRAVVLRDEQIADSASAYFNDESPGDTVFDLGGKLVLNHVTETVDNLYGRGQISATNSTLRTDSTFFAGVITGDTNSVIVKYGVHEWVIGEQFVDGYLNYAGRFQVVGGTLALNSAFRAASVTVGPNSTLAGIGEVKSLTLNGGIVAPGYYVEGTSGNLTVGKLISNGGKYHCSLAPVFGDQPTMDSLSVDDVQGALELRVLCHSAGLLGFAHPILKRNSNPVPVGTFVGLADKVLVTANSGQMFRLNHAGGWSGLDATLTQTTWPTPARVDRIDFGTNGTGVVTGTGIPGMRYAVFACTNLANPVWDLLTDTTATTPDGTIRVTDYGTSLHPIRFYRIESR